MLKIRDTSRLAAIACVIAARGAIGTDGGDRESAGFTSRPPPC
jgi:hypothetical protein